MPNQRIGIEERIAKEAALQAKTWAKQIAGVQGPGPGARLVTGKEELELWNEKAADPVALYQQYLEQGMDDISAKTKATIEAFPNRAPMLLSSGTDAESQIAYAHRMNRLSQQSELAEESGEKSLTETHDIPAQVQAESRPQQRNESGYA